MSAFLIKVTCTRSFQNTFGNKQFQQIMWEFNIETENTQKNALYIPGLNLSCSCLKQQQFAVLMSERQYLHQSYLIETHFTKWKLPFRNMIKNNLENTTLSRQFQNPIKISTNRHKFNARNTYIWSLTFLVKYRCFKKKWRIMLSFESVVH